MMAAKIGPGAAHAAPILLPGCRQPLPHARRAALAPLA